jgi:hypothetical protein
MRQSYVTSVVGHDRPIFQTLSFTFAPHEVYEGYHIKVRHIDNDTL